MSTPTNRPTLTPPSDPELEALLDTALAPAPLPAGLEAKILAATDPGVRALAPQMVLSRRSPWRLALAAAAGVALIGGIVTAYVNLGGSADAPQVAVQPSPVAPPSVDSATQTAGAQPDVVETSALDHVSLAAIQRELDRLAAAELSADTIDDRIELLSMQVRMTDSDGFWSQKSMDSLDTAIVRDELDQLAMDLEIYF